MLEKDDKKSLVHTNENKCLSPEKSFQQLQGKFTERDRFLLMYEYMQNSIKDEGGTL